ncbi:MAG: hypothetical protein PHQ43_08330 [Dehalococcoidales bacterium]|nr:hypothetical protein [Dehalococcoidales bacterium]
MAGTPVARAMEVDFSKGQDTTGAARDFWMRFPGLSAASDCDSAHLLYYCENPFYQDLIILEALIVITTLDAHDGDIDVGLCDDAVGTDAADTSECICDSMVNNAAGVFSVLNPPALACTTSLPIWKAKGTSTDSYLSVTQNADADVSSLRWGLMLRVMPYNDALNAQVANKAITDS